MYQHGPAEEWVIGGLLLGISLAVLIAIFWLWMIVHCITNPRLKPMEKFLWVLVLIFAHLWGAIFYFILGRRKRGGLQHPPSARLYRSRSDKLIAGVCGGVASYYKVDASVMRLAWLLITLLGGSGILLYLICWIVIPKEPKRGK